MSDAAPDLLLRLLADQSERWARGQPIYVESYLQSYPSVAADDEQVLDLVSNEIYIRCSHGPVPPLDEYRGRFPKLAEAIEVQFELHRAAQAPARVDSARPTVSAPSPKSARSWRACRRFPITS